MVLFFFVLQIALFLTLCQFWQFYNLNVNFDKNKDQSVEKLIIVFCISNIYCNVEIGCKNK
jgi:hypothetical protein